MTNLPVIENNVLTDNWSLELVSDVIESGLSLTEIADLYSGYDNRKKRRPFIEFGTPFQSLARKDPPTESNAIALLQLLDLIVTYDQIFYDHRYSDVWDNSVSLKPIMQLLQPISREVADTAETLVVEENVPAEIDLGAAKYFNLGRFLDLPYWPSPQRSTALTKYFTPVNKGYVHLLKQGLDSSIREALLDALSPIKLENSYTSFPGFGASILANCSKPVSILPTALEFRNTSEARAFRSWIWKLDKALIDGNFLLLAQEIQELQDVLYEVYRGLGLNNDLEAVQLQLGLSPALGIEVQTVKSFTRRFKKESLHITFIRQHLSRVLNSAFSEQHIRRLFPKLTM